MNRQVKMLFAFKLLFDKGSLFFIPSVPPPKRQKRSTTFAYPAQSGQKLTKNLIILPFFSTLEYLINVHNGKFDFTCLAKKDNLMLLN